MEAAIQAVLAYAQILRQKHQDFLDQYHDQLLNQSTKRGMEASPKLK